jgi:threonine dehydratase
VTDAQPSARARHDLAVEADVNVPVDRLVSLADIEAAAERLQDLIKATPVEKAHALSKAASRDIYLKHEYLQRTGSYKVRGAYNRIAQLPPGVGVVAASAGNHAQGVALAAELTGRHATIYMPAGAPLPKIDATRSYGAAIELVEGGVEECLAAAIAHAERGDAVFVPPFDDLDVIAGQGTVGLELARDLPDDVETVVVPIGGGGLISGVATALKSLRPNIRVVGVQPAGASSMKQSVEAGRSVTLEHLNTMADGIAVRRPADLTLAHVKQYVDDIVTVSEEAIGMAVLQLLERAKAVVEPAGAVGLAAVLTSAVSGTRPVCVVLTGGNIDPILLSKVIDFGLTAAGRYLRMRIILDDRAGLLAHLSKTLSDMNLNVVLIEHHKAGLVGLAFNEVEVQLTLETRDPEQHDEIVAELTRRGFPVELMR